MAVGCCDLSEELSFAGWCTEASYSDSLYSPPLNPLPTNPHPAKLPSWGGVRLCEPIHEPQGPAVKLAGKQVLRPVSASHNGG